MMGAHSIWGNFRRGLVALSLAAIALAFLAGCSSSEETTESGGTTESAGSLEGTEAIDIAFTTLDGTTQQLSDLRGKTVVVNFWATWCPYCVEELPDFSELADANPDVEFVLLNCAEDKETVQDYIQENSNLSTNFVWVLDENGAAIEAYSLEGIPYTIVVAPDGTIVEEHEGSCVNVVGRFQSAIDKAKSVA